MSDIMTLRIQSRERQRHRADKLKEIANEFGFKTWRLLETDAIHGKLIIQRRQDADQNDQDPTSNNLTPR